MSDRQDQKLLVNEQKFLLYKQIVWLIKRHATATKKMLKSRQSKLVSEKKMYVKCKNQLTVSFHHRLLLLLGDGRSHLLASLLY